MADHGSWTAANLDKAGRFSSFAIAFQCWRSRAQFVKRPCVLAVLDEKETEDQICFKDAEIRMVSLDHYLGVQLWRFLINQEPHSSTITQFGFSDEQNIQLFWILNINIPRTK